MAFAIMFYVTASSVVSVIFFTFPCQPVAAAWDITIPNPRCINEVAWIYANAALNISTDVLTLILPIKLCWGLQRTFKQKLLLIVLFMMGSL